MAQLEEAHVQIEMPPVTAEYLIGHLMDAGLVDVGGMGQAPLSWTTLRHWREQTGVRLSPWEARLLRRLSSEYIAEQHRAEAIDAKAPWSDVASLIAGVMVDRELDALFDEPEWEE